jgi:hypothetical protein
MLAAMSAISPLEGTLFRYRTSPGSLQAFESPIMHGHKRFVIYIGGLTDGLLACAYVEALAAMCDDKGWAFVQPLLSSSFAGYGCSSLAKDTQELAELASYLERTREVSALAFIGHSTGCQDIVHLLGSEALSASLRRKVCACALQAPVSDREAWSLEEDVAQREELLALAQRMVGEGRGSQLLPELHYGFVPICAARYASLFGIGGDDDLFSSYFSDAELAARLGHLSQPGLHVLFAHSAADEYVPKGIDVTQHSRRLVAAAGGDRNGDGGVRALVIEGANHNLASPDSAAGTFIEAVGELLDRAVGRTFTTEEDF